MSRTIWLILLLLFLFLATIFFWKFSCLCGPAAVVPPVKDKCSESWNLKDGNFSLNVNEHVSFARNGVNHFSSSTKINNEMSRVASYLKENSNKVLNVSGLSGVNEKAPQDVKDLGLARANDIKQWLTKLGAPANQIEVNSKKADEACFIDKYKKDNKTLGTDGKIDFLKRGAMFSFTTKKVERSTQQIAADLKGKNLILYFNTNEADPNNMTPKLEKDFEDINRYLTQVKDARLDVVGHTDNRGDRNYNVNLSKERAQFAKEYLVREFKLPNARMDVKGMGPDKPAADNNSDAGRQKNRRVEVTLK